MQKKKQLPIYLFKILFLSKLIKSVRINYVFINACASLHVYVCNDIRKLTSMLQDVLRLTSLVYKNVTQSVFADRTLIQSLILQVDQQVQSEIPEPDALVIGSCIIISAGFSKSKISRFLHVFLLILWDLSYFPAKRTVVNLRGTFL